MEVQTAWGVYRRVKAVLAATDTAMKRKHSRLANSDVEGVNLNDSLSANGECLPPPHTLRLVAAVACMVVRHTVVKGVLRRYFCI